MYIFIVIRNPIDLGSITKKVKNQNYRNSEEFIEDLYLIYSNCFEYNTDPKSIYRYHAEKMREKTNELLEEFPDYSAEDEFSTLSMDEHGVDTSSIEGVILNSFNLNLVKFLFGF